MANIAQLVNVLQAMVLTEGDRMLLTPTYHVFEMYKNHQDARQLESYVETSLAGEAAESQVPNLHISASQGPDGTVLVTAANLDDAQGAELDCALAGLGRIERVTGRVLAGAAGAHNTFDAPETVRPVALEGIELTADGFKASLPPCCVAAFEVKPA